MITRTPAVRTFHGLHTGEYGSVKKCIYLSAETILRWFTRTVILVSKREAELITKARFIDKNRLRIIDNGVIVPEKVRSEPDNTKLPL